MCLMIIRIHRGRYLIISQLWRKRWIISQRLIRKIESDCNKPKSVYPPLQPKARYVQQAFLNLWFVEIQIGLGGQKIMQIILAAPRVPMPRRPTDNRQPIVGGGAVRFGISPNIPVGFRVIATFAAFGKPRVLVSGVTLHQINHYLKPERMGRFHHAI